MAHDYHIASSIRQRIALLDPVAQRTLLDCLDELLQNPEPDGISRVAAPPYFPYRAGAITARCAQFRISYEIVNNGLVLHIFSISPLPELPYDSPPFDLDADAEDVD